MLLAVPKPKDQRFAQLLHPKLQQAQSPCSWRHLNICTIANLHILTLRRAQGIAFPHSHRAYASLPLRASIFNFSPFGRLRASHFHISSFSLPEALNQPLEYFHPSAGSGQAICTSPHLHIFTLIRYGFRQSYAFSPFTARLGLG